MRKYHLSLGLLAAIAFLPATAQAQEAETEAANVETAADQDKITNTIDVDARCELHVWPTENYLGVKMGLLSGFGAIGAAIDHAGHRSGVQTVKDLMRNYLGPEVQMEELDRLDYRALLGLGEEYRVIMHEPTPFGEDVKKDKALKAEVKAFNTKLKNGERVSDSSNDCYAELVTTHIFYHKAMMYGSNLFTGWQLRVFDGDRIVRDGTGQVKNPLEHFPPKDDTMIEAAQAELRDAYSKDFVEWVEKKSGA